MAKVSNIQLPDGTTLELSGSGSGYHPNIFDTKWSDHLINDIQWLRADTFSWQDGTVYTTAYNKLVEEYSTGTEETEDDIIFKRSANGFKIATADYESAILSKYTSDGIAWYYILDTTNQRFKLPRTKFGFEGLRDNVGDYVSESLPDHKHYEFVSTSRGTSADSSATQYLTSSEQVSSLWYSGYAAYNMAVNSEAADVGLSSSAIGDTYQDNAPVQERATQMYLYFYVGEYSQTAIEQTAGITSEQLNAKVDISSLVEVPAVLKTTYVNGTSGYNIWSNGYCEQWGKTNVLSSNTTTTISLLKTMADGNYNIVTTERYDGGTSDNNNENYWLYAQPSTTSFVIYNSAAGYRQVYWKASGYLAEGEY